MNLVYLEVDERIKKKIISLFENILSKSLTNKSVLNLIHFVESWKWIKMNIKNNKINESLILYNHRKISYQEFIRDLKIKNKINISYIELIILIFSIK